MVATSVGVVHVTPFVNERRGPPEGLRGVLSVLVGVISR